MLTERSRCVAPVGPDVGPDRWESQPLCGEPAVCCRMAGGLECPLCQEHADEFDRDAADESAEESGVN